jgi:hypothetical protein
MSLTHPVFPPENNATTNLPTAFANLNAALRALDGADTLVIDAGATALNTVLPRIPQVLAVHGTPSALDGSGRYVLRLPSNGATDQILIVANRTGAPLRLTTADGANALVASLAAGRIEAFVLSGSTIGAYALSSTRTGKAATAHTHPASEVTGLATVATSGGYADLTGRPPLVRRALYRAGSTTTLANADWRAIAYNQVVGTDEIGLIWSEDNRTFQLPSGFTKMRVVAQFALTATFTFTTSLALTKNAPSVNQFGSSWEGMILSEMPAAFTYFGGLSSGWVDVSPSDLFRFIARPNGNPGGTTARAHQAHWIQVEAY